LLSADLPGLLQPLGDALRFVVARKWREIFILQWPLVTKPEKRLNKLANEIWPPQSMKKGNVLARRGR